MGPKHLHEELRGVLQRAVLHDGGRVAQRKNAVTAAHRQPLVRLQRVHVALHCTGGTRVTQQLPFTGS